MTQTLAVNKNNDIFIGTDGNLAIAKGQQAMLFACASAAKSQLNEMVLAFDQGVANFQTIWKNSANVAQFELSLRTAIENVDGVDGISDLTISVGNNTLSYVATIQTIYGEGTING